MSASESSPQQNLSRLGNSGAKPIDFLLDQFLDDVSKSTLEPRGELTERIQQIGTTAEITVENCTIDDQPQVLGPYEIRGSLGTGGMGRVFRARHRHLNREVALKTINPTRALSLNATSRFQREMQALAALDHPNVVRAYDGNIEANVAYLAMELIEGADLRQIESDSLSVSSCCQYILQAALGLSALHEAGMLHRDIKPSNLMLTRDGTVKIVDLGLAKLEEDEAELTSQRSIVGTEKFMAPEQLEGRDDLDSRVDIYALGQTFKNLLERQQETIPSTLRQLIGEMTKPNRDDRIASAAFIVERLQEILASDKTEMLSDESQCSKASSRFSVIAWGLVVLLSCGVAIAVWNHSVRNPSLTSEDSSASELQSESLHSAITGSTQPRIDTEREAVEWLLANSGAATVNVLEGGDWVGWEFHELDHLPSHRISVQKVKLPTRPLLKSELSYLRLFENLEGVEMHHDSVGDDLIAQFQPDWNLKWLNIPTGAVTNSGIAKLKPFADSLLFLDASDSQITDSGLESLKTFSVLRGLILRWTHVTGKSLKSLQEFPSLVLVDLSGTKIDGPDIKHLVECPKLTRLILSDLPLTDKDVSPLISLPLTELGLERTNVSQQKIDEFRTAKPDCTIYY